MSTPAAVKTQLPTFLVMLIPTSLKITLPALLVTPLFPAFFEPLFPVLYMTKSLTSLETLSLNIQPFLLSLRDHSLLSSI